MGEEQQKMREALQADLPRSVVKQRSQGGGGVSYVTGFYVIDTLNQVLGNGCWGYDIEDLRVVATWEDDKKRARVSYLAIVTLHGMSLERITDTGTGHGIDHDPGQAHESASKEAVTDALKRAAKSLGRRLGLALYDKSQEHVADPVVDVSKELGWIEQANSVEELKSISPKLKPFTGEARAKLVSAYKVRLAMFKEEVAA